MGARVIFVISKRYQQRTMLSAAWKTSWASKRSSKC